MLKDMKEEILAYSKRSYKEGLFAGTSGNLSIYDAEKEIMGITPSGVDYDTMTLDDIVLMKPDGTVLEGELKPSSEWRMHAKIYEKCPEFTAVVHTHSPYATSFAVSHQTIPVILIEMVPFLGGDVPLSEFAMPGTEELGDKVVTALKNRFGCLLANHGVVAVGCTMKKAHSAAVYTEDAARILTLAKARGETIHRIPDDVVAKMREKYNLPQE